MAVIRHSTTAAGTNNPNKQVSVVAWNDDHLLSGTADSVLGFDAAGNAVEKTVTEVAISRSDMAALRASAGKAVFLRESGREGTFVFSSSNLSSQVSSDTQQGIYVAPSSDTSGASGAWVRKYSGPADIRWFGASTAATAAANQVAVQAALTVASDVRIPTGTFACSGNIIPPSGASICGPGTIDFDPTAYFAWLKLSGNVTNVKVVGVTFTCSIEADFTHFIRMSQGTGETLDGFDFLNNVIDYPIAPGSTADRWAVAGTGNGTRKNVRVNGNRLTGAMQLVATPVAVGTFRDSEICGNRIHNARSNAISLLSAGDINAAYPCTLDNVKVTDNVITADAYTSIGIVVGIDSAGANDKNTNIKNVLIANNKIDISASSNKTSDIWIRLGNKCAAIGGFDSVSDSIIIANNELHYGVTIAQNPVSAASRSQISNFVLQGNKFVNSGTGIDIILRYLATGAIVAGNTCSIGASIRLGENNGTIYSRGNTYSTLTNISNDAEFTWRSTHDVYRGSASSTDRVCTFNANAGKVQTAYFDHCTIDTSTTGPSGIRSAIYTLGAGNPTVTVRDMTSSTSWLLGLYEVSTGSITETNSFVSAVTTAGNFSTTGGQFLSTQANSTANGGGQVYLNGASGNRIDWNTNGSGAPAFTTRSAGTRLCFYPGIDSSHVDFAMGIEPNFLWTSTLQAASTQGFKWYGGTTNVATLTGAGSFTVTGALGFQTGAGGTVTQATSRTTGVTINKSCGAITLFSAAGSATWATFTVTNSTVAATDTIELCQKSGANLYNAIVTAVAAGSFNISVSAVSGTATEAPVFNFIVIKAVTA